MNAATKTSSEPQESQDSGSIPLIAGVALGVLWSAGVTAFLLGYNGAAIIEMAPQQIGGLIFICVGPALAFSFAGWAAREMLLFARTARLLNYSVRRLTAPVSQVKGDARAIADAIAEQVERLNKDAEATLARLVSMEEALAVHVKSLDDVLRTHSESMQATSKNARVQVDELVEDLRRERSALSDLSDHLKTETAKISETIERQTEIVSTATRVAANQADEGRGMLEKSAVAMTDAASAAQTAGEKAALAIDEQLRDMQALVNALEERGGRLEEVARIHSENVKIVQQTSHELNMAAEGGADSMKAASEAAIEQARRVSEVIEKETARAVQRGMEEIERMRRAAQAAREAADSAGLALEANADAVLERVRAANAAILDADRGAAGASAPVRPRVETPPPPPRPRAEAPSAAQTERPDRSDRSERSDRRAALDEDWGGDRAGAGFRNRRPAESERPIELDAHVPPPPPSRDAGRRNPNSRYADTPPPRSFEDLARNEGAQRGSAMNGRRPAPGPAPASRGGRSMADDLGDDLDDGYGHSNGANHNGDDSGEWRWRDLLKNIDEAPAAMLAGEAVVSGLRRAGVDPARALDPDMTARVARARRRAGSGEARALVLDGALNEVRRTSAALAADPTLRGRAEEFVGEHARLVRRAIDENDAGLLSSLLDSDMGRAYLLLDAALADG